MPPKKKVLRSDVRQDVFGVPVELTINSIKLPTIGDVARDVLFERHKLFERQENKQEPSVKDLAGITAKKVVQLWEKASVSGEAVIGEKRIVEKILDYHKKGRSLMKSASSPSGKEKIKEFRKKVDSTLFDIASCKCEDPVLKCSCPRVKKIPALEIAFVLDQRKDRKMCIGSVDEEVTSLLQNREQRKRRAHDHLMRVKNPRILHVVDDGSSSDQQGATSGTDSDFEVPKEQGSHKQMRTSLPHLASAVYRANVSANKAAMIASSVLADLVILFHQTITMLLTELKFAGNSGPLLGIFKRNRRMILEREILKESTLTGRRMPPHWF